MSATGCQRAGVRRGGLVPRALVSAGLLAGGMWLAAPRAEAFTCASAVGNGLSWSTATTWVGGSELGVGSAGVVSALR